MGIPETVVYERITAYFRAMKKALVLFFLLWVTTTKNSYSQDTFSIVAIDSVTGEVGSAGASCVDLLLYFPNYPIDFLGDLLPGQGAINTQASYDTTNQNNARIRLLAGDTPQQVIGWLTANDVTGNPAIRQYGIAAFVNGSSQTAGYTGTSTLNYKNHIAGPNYCIQGNILLGQSILDSIESRFLNEPGDLACKLMAALQGAKVVGADTRCTSNNSSSLFAFLKVAQPTDTYGSPSLLVKVKTPGGAGIEPIDSLQTLFDAAHSCQTSSVSVLNPSKWITYPNPVSDELIIEWVMTSLEPSYRLLDTNGRVVRASVLEKSPTAIDMGDIPPGSYILEISNGEETLREKIVKR